MAKIAYRIMTKSHRNARPQDREYICSEYVWKCYSQIGIKINYDPRGFIAPADFAKANDVKLLAVLQRKS